MQESISIQAAAAAAGSADVKVTYMPLIMKALSAALREFPEVNATVNADATELTCRGRLAACFILVDKAQVVG